MFVKEIIRKMGFHHTWIRWIMSCISSVTYSFNFNGSSYGFIEPSRGLRQGDLLSPFLFLFCAEGFSSLLGQAEAVGEISGVSIARRSPSISHLLFADDSLLFFKASVSQATIIRDLLRQYASASGQEINLAKSSLFFRRNTLENLRVQLKQILNVIRIGGQDKYLGIPALVTKSKSETFKEISLKVKQKVSGWKGSLLSYGGREVLIKSVATAVPISTGLYRISDGVGEIRRTSYIGSRGGKFA
ncbi:uncharacterized protein LOC126661842 [Mercurialis annua]|uniref:uncharacterized protein LOC126661842 n=1 Tax=Mercurialis annua TaxID=3986 RepID=UPI00215F84E4|nr:uncharacterized protein LOC126661842 [Mercurialis annua]